MFSTDLGNNPFCLVGLNSFVFRHNVPAFQNENKLHPHTNSEVVQCETATGQTVAKPQRSHPLLGFLRSHAVFHHQN